ncbi:MAG: hypothetical protein V1661_03135, partial [bacterium]
FVPEQFINLLFIEYSFAHISNACLIIFIVPLHKKSEHFRVHFMGYRSFRGGFFYFVSPFVKGGLRGILIKIKSTPALLFQRRELCAELDGLVIL